MKDEQKLVQVYALLTKAERQRLKIAQAIAGTTQQAWNREALLEKLEREERRK